MNPRILLPLLAAAVLVPAGTPPARAADPPGRPGWTVVQETRVRVTGRLLLRAGTSPPVDAPLDWSLEPGHPAPLALALGEHRPVRVGLVVTAEPIEATGRIRLRIEADVQPTGAPPTSSSRTLELDPGRAGLVELWTDARGERRLVAVLAATTEEVPRLERITPATRPVDLLVEILAGEGNRRRTVERLRLAALVGSPARYSLASVPGAADDGADPALRVELELLPAALRDGELELHARVTVHRGPGNGAERPGTGDRRARVLASEASTSGRVAPGGSLELPLPRGAGTEPVTFRVTAFF